jgi:hypothetical protein
MTGPAFLLKRARVRSEETMIYRDNKLPFEPTPTDMVQFSTFHMAVVKDVKDPDNRGRIRVEAPSILSVGKDNWSNWCEASMPAGSAENPDVGSWRVPTPGEAVLIGFIGGDPDMPFIIPGPVWSKKKGSDQTQIPGEVKKIMDDDGEGSRKGTRIEIPFMTEAGAGIVANSNAGEQSLIMYGPGKAGAVPMFVLAPSKGTPEKEGKGEKSKILKEDDRRGDRDAVTKTNEDVGTCCKGPHIMGSCDPNGTGITFVAEKGKGRLMMSANTGGGGEANPSIVLDTVSNSIVLTAGSMQLTISGKHGHIEVTRQIIQEQIKTEVKPLFTAVADAVKGAFMKHRKAKRQEVAAKDGKPEISGGNESGGSGSSPSNSGGGTSNMG